MGETLKVDGLELQPGDHIFIFKNLSTYSHHGIYVGNEYVIHFQPTQRIPSTRPTCQKCGYNRNKDLGVVKTCLDCFMTDVKHVDDHLLHLYEYGVSQEEYESRSRGTCCTLESKPLDEAVKTATELKTNEEQRQKDGFVSYDLLQNNCEHFATFCRTGTKFCSQTDLIKRESVLLL